MSGERPLFFSGGTALRPLSQYFASRKFPSSHLITTFDSGGSTAALRKAFAIPAVGDLRNRLLALADTDRNPPAVFAFCNTRLARDVSFKRGRKLLEESLKSPLLDESPEEFRQISHHHLSRFISRAPKDFDARGASLGNLLLTAAYLENGGDLEAAIDFFASLLHICGSIAPIVSSSLHLGARLNNGQIIIGQHNFTNLSGPVARLFLTVHESAATLESAPVQCKPGIAPMAADFLREARLLCFPMGSFYSSVLCNLLPQGTGRGVAANPCPKIFIPNSGHDKESAGMTIAEQAGRILDALLEDEPGARVQDLLNYVLVDRQHGQYAGNIEISLGSLRDMGIRIIDRPVVSRDNPARHIPEALFELICEMLARGDLA